MLPLLICLSLFSFTQIYFTLGEFGTEILGHATVLGVFAFFGYQYQNKHLGLAVGAICFALFLQTYYNAKISAKKALDNPVPSPSPSNSMQGTMQVAYTGAIGVTLWVGLTSCVLLLLSIMFVIKLALEKGSMASNYSNKGSLNTIQS